MELNASTPTPIPKGHLDLPAQLRFTVELEWENEEEPAETLVRYPELLGVSFSSGTFTVNGPLPVLFRWLLNEYDAAEAEQLWNELARRDWLTG